MAHSHGMGSGKAHPLHRIAPRTIGFAVAIVALCGVGYLFWRDARLALAGGTLPSGSTTGPLGGADTKFPPHISNTAGAGLGAVNRPALPAGSTNVLGTLPPSAAFAIGQQPRPGNAWSSLPTPAEQGATAKMLVEGHWQGMELIELVPALASTYNLDPSVRGLLIDEVSLLAAASNLRAGDVVYKVGGLDVASLRDFRDATFLLRNETQVEINMFRKGQPLAATLRSARPLGFAMSEGASPIPPGAISPHQDRGRPCTDCHIIMAQGGQLAIDAGDLLPTPPAIQADANAPHSPRGPCATCHRILGKP